MATVETTRRLTRAGRFGEALSALTLVKGLQVQHPSTRVLRCELLQLTGAIQEARLLADELLAHPKHLSLSEQSTCEYVLARVAREDANVTIVIDHLQRSASLARAGADLQALCRAQLTLMTALSDRSGPDAVVALAAEIRANVTRLGDPHMTASLHVTLSELEAKQSHVHNARRHSQLALDILASDPNCWLQARAENILFAIDLCRSDLTVGNAKGLSALKLAESSGHAAMCRNCLGNLGNFFHLTGQYECAVSHFERSLAIVHAKGSQNNAALESLARAHLTYGRLAESSALLDRVLESVGTEADRQLYVHRQTEFTKAQLLAREGRLDEAIARTDLVISLAERTGDRLLLSSAWMTKAEMLLDAGNVADALALLDETAPHLMIACPELYLQYERTLARAAATTGDRDDAAGHRRRGLRLARALGHVPAELELERCSETMAYPASFDESPHRGSSAAIAQSTLHTVSALVLNPDRLEFVARELASVLEATSCVYSAVAVARTARGDVTLEVAGDPSQTSPDAPTRTLALGRQHDRDIVVTFRPRTDVQSIATINAVTLFVSALQELERARREREDLAVLWPVDDLPIDGDASVISGHMRELMRNARRIATTNVSVLITGESGTGKEILARAVHTFSGRARKPFVPFNCTTVPHDLLESQLFGHRRGAFTGADRDHAGLIRSAREGTLFLDEIGELGLDLQPKLLRFLESGELATLGDLHPSKADVRVIAATNRNLEEAVRAGRFREDLFYRLNVVRLSIRPLRERRDEIPGLVHHFVARAAEEFDKGRITVAEETVERLLLYRWPGNVRHLQNEVRRIVALAEPNSTITPDAIAPEILGALPVFQRAGVNGGELCVSLKAKLIPTLVRIEREMIRAAFKEHGGKVNAVAKALGISRKGLYLKRQRLGL